MLYMKNFCTPHTLQIGLTLLEVQFPFKKWDPVLATNSGIGSVSSAWLWADDDYNGSNLEKIVAQMFGKQELRPYLLTFLSFFFLQTNILNYWQFHVFGLRKKMLD